MKLSDKAIERITVKYFSTKPLKVIEISSGVMTYKYQIYINDESYVLRVYPHNRKHIAQVEYEIFKRTFNVGCKVPEALYLDESEELAYIIYRMLPGEALASNFENLSNDEQCQLSIQIVQNIILLSTVNSSNSYGGIGEKRYESWGMFLKHTIDYGDPVLKKTKLITSIQSEKLKSFMVNQINCLNSKASLVWSDFSTSNIIVNKNKLSGLIDFEGCIIGDPILSLGYLFAKEGESKFFQSIQNEAKSKLEILPEQIIFYSFIRLYRLMKYYYEPLPIGIERQNPFDFFSGLNDSLKFIGDNY